MSATMIAASRRSARAVAVAMAAPQRGAHRGEGAPHSFSAAFEAFLACRPYPRCQCMISASDLLGDGIRIGSPEERPRVPLVLLDEAVDRFLQVDKRGGVAVLEPSPGQLGEQSL